MTCSLPTGWELAPLRDLGHWTGGGTPSKGQQEYWSNGTIPWVSPKDMKVTVLGGAEDHITPAAIEGSATSIVPQESVIVVVRSGILKHSLPVAVNAVPVALNQDLKALTPPEGVASAFVAWALRRFEREILHNCAKAGTTVQSIEFPQLLAFSVPVPPPTEQHRIVAAIEEHLSRLDAAVAGLERVRAALPRYRAAVLKAACEGRLVAGDGVRSPTVPVGELLASPMVNGRSVPSAPMGFPVLRLTALHDGIVDLTERKLGAWSATDASRYLVRTGDFLVARGNGSLRLVGRGGLVVGDPDPVAFPDTMIRMRPDETRLLPTYLRLVWDSPLVRQQIERGARTSAGIHKVNQRTLSTIALPVPSIRLQAQTVAEAERRLSLADAVERTVTAGLAKAKRLRQAILKRAFEGKLVPQDPTDEPAGVLLERIKSERAKSATRVTGVTSRAAPRAPHTPRILPGRVSSRYGVAARNLKTVEKLILERTGLPSMAPGTLNVELPFEFVVRADATIEPHEYFAGERIKLQRCRVRGQRMVIMRPETHEVPSAGGARVLELVSPLQLRATWGLRDGDLIEVEVDGDQAWWDQAETNVREVGPAANPKATPRARERH